MVLEGIHSEAAFIAKHPSHWGIGKLRQEAMEGWIGLAKYYLRKCGNHREGWLLKMCDFLDLYCVGAVYCNLVDFTRIKYKHYMFMKLVYNGYETERIQIALEGQLPRHCGRILKLIDSIEFKGTIPSELQNILCNMSDDMVDRLIQN